ncbi:MAG: hypothetical protein IT324_20050 [Anaerolineae bacterium]|nr:hypothetical protein [Anaerolineae bacterium]
MMAITWSITTTLTHHYTTNTLTIQIITPPSQLSSPHHRNASLSHDTRIAPARLHHCHQATLQSSSQGSG